MADETRNIIMRLLWQGKDAEQGADRLKRSFTEINQATELGRKAFGAAKFAADSLFNALDRAQTVEGVARGFETLQQQAGLLADNSLQKLRIATQGLVSDFDLMQQANQAVQLGLDPSKLDIMAEAAVKLGAAVGRTAQEAFGDLVTGLGRASPLILDNLGITIKASEAQERYAATLKKATKDLTENEKAEAFRFAALEKIEEKAASLADVQLNAGQAAQKLAAQFTNLRDEVLLSLQSDTELRDILLDLSQSIQDFDTTNLVAAIRAVTEATAESIEFVNQWSHEIRAMVDPLGQMRDAVLEGERDIAKFTNTTQEQLEHIIGLRANVERASQALEEMAAKHGETSYEAIRAAGTLQGYKRALELAEDKLLTFEDTSTKAQVKTKALGTELDKTKDKAKDFFDVFDQWDEIVRAGWGDLFDPVDFEKGFADLFKDMEEAGRDAAEDYEDALEDAYRDTTNFYRDLMVAAINGDIEGALKSMLLNAAIDFAAELAARATLQLALSLGGSGGGGGFDYGSLISSAFGIAQTSATGASGANGAAGAFGSLGSTGATGAALGVSASTLGLAAAAAVAAYFGYEGLSAGWDLTNKPQSEFTNQDALQVAGTYFNPNAFVGIGYGVNEVFGGDSDKYFSQLGWLDPATSPLYLADALGANLSFLNFGTGKRPDQLFRDEIRDLFRDQGITDNDHNLPIFGGGSYNLGQDEVKLSDVAAALYGQDSTKVSNLTTDNKQFIGLGNLLSSTLTGADPVNGIGAMFANALAAADSFNAAILTTIGIFDKLGLTTEQVGDSLTQSMLDGSLSIEQYNADMATLQQLSLESLGSVTDAVHLLADTIDGPPRDSLKAMEILFGTATDSGIQDMQALAAEMEIQLGEKGRSVVEQFAAAGIDLFTDFSTLSNEQIQFIINNIQLLVPALEQVGEASGGAAGAVERSAGRMVGSLKSVESQAKETGLSIKHLIE